MSFYFQLKFWQLWKKYIVRAFVYDREPFLIGKINIDKVNINEAKTFSYTEIIEARLLNIGYQPNYFSYGDKCQITSMRKMYVDSDSYWRQIHVRVFEDDEVRVHDELSYEEDAKSHLDGKSLRMPLPEELAKIIGALNVISPL